MPRSRRGDTTATNVVFPELLLPHEEAAELRLDLALAGGEQLSDLSRLPLLCTHAVVKSS